MTLRFNGRVRAGGFLLDADIVAGDDEVVAVLGPNGAGKSTLLRAIAGLIPLEAGRIDLDGTVLDDVERGIRVPTERRPLGVVFQDHLLFPHLSVLENVAFGLRSRGMRKREARREASTWLDRVGLHDRAESRPHELSGGQAQRVSLARAMAARPLVILLDEPLSALDASTRPAMRRELRIHLAAFPGTRLLVTHDPLEAAALADRMVILEEGRVVQSGTPADVRARPRSRFVADLVGLNLFEGIARDGRVVFASGAELTVAGTPSGDVMATIHPRAIALYRNRPDGTPRNVWAGTVDSIDSTGDRVRVQILGPLPVVAEVTPASAAALRLSEGGEVWVSIKATEIDTYSA